MREGFFKKIVVDFCLPMAHGRRNISLKLHKNLCQNNHQAKDRLMGNKEGY